MEQDGLTLMRARKPGRRRAIPEELEPVIVELYRQGNGYRAIARILRTHYGINPHFSSVRKTLIRLGVVIRREKHEENRFTGKA